MLASHHLSFDFSRAVRFLNFAFSQIGHAGSSNRRWHGAPGRAKSSFEFQKGLLLNKFT